MSEYIITTAEPADVIKILDLYKIVAAEHGGLARTEDEIDAAYVEHFVSKSVTTGIILIAVDHRSETVIGEIHGYALGPKSFAHVLGELTIAIHPDFQGKGLGKALFTEFLNRVKSTRPDILRVELIARESNEKAIRFYEKLGFLVEGKMVGRIASVGGGFESDIPMAWHRE